jgi:hydroxyethylthiazole kinase-like uncharacterized protein yjeF
VRGGPILTAAQMRAAERAVFDAGTPEYALMERAGAACAEIIWRAGSTRDTLVLCGPGNNGGDGFVIARLLAERGVPVRVAATGESGTESSARARAAWNGPIENIDGVAPAAQVVDALFGTGLGRGLEAGLADMLGRLVRAAGHSYAIDLPSGVDTDSGRCLSPVPRFGLCIALGAWKPAHALRPASGCCARAVLADIDIQAGDAHVRVLEAPVIEAPAPDAHKYSRGLVAVVAGEMAGAGMLAASAAAHGGAGYVRLIGDGAVTAASHAIVMNSVDVGVALTDKRISAVLVGPGLGRSRSAATRLEAALAASHPLVVDADGLVLLADLGMAALPEGAILTPHEGEFVRLFGDFPGSKIDRAVAAARMARGVVIYKGSDTVIAAPDGRAAVAPGASSWLSTAGTGDVLAGVCAARLAVTGDAFRAACEAVWLHGEAARRAGAAFVADALIPQIPAAISCRL